MGDEERFASDPEGTPPDGTDPEPDPQGTPPEGEETGSPPPDDPAKGTGIETAKTPEPEGRAWENFRKKYPNVPEEQLQDFFAEQWWEKSTYAKEQRERADREAARADRAEQQLEDIRKKAEGDKDKTPHPDVEKIANKVRALVEKDKGLFAQQGQARDAYNKAFTEAQQARGKADLCKTNGDEDGAARWESTAISLESRAQSHQTRLEMIADRRQEVADRVNDLIAEQDFVQNFSEERKREEETERQEREARQAAFPKWVDEQAASLAKEFELPDDKHTMARLHTHVRRAIHYDLDKPDIKERRLDSLPLERMIKGYVEEFMRDNDIKARRKFNQISRDKLETTPPRRPTPPKGRTGEEPPKPERPKGPVPVSFLARGGSEIPEAWKRGREHLKRAGLD